MFSSLLKEKLKIENKVAELQHQFLQILSAPVRGTEFTQSSLEETKTLLTNKLEENKKIKLEYTAALNLEEQLSQELAEAKETTEIIENLLDQLFESFNLKIPQELAKPSEQSSVPTTPEPVYREYDDEDKENSQLHLQSPLSSSFNQSEQEEESDKENSESENYFSPNVQIKKSFSDPNTTCYTPAVKSHSKRMH